MSKIIDQKAKELNQEKERITVEKTPDSSKINTPTLSLYTNSNLVTPNVVTPNLVTPNINQSSSC